MFDAVGKSDVAEVVAARLQREGVGAVFGVPGGPIMRLFVALLRLQIRVVLCKSELGAVFAADGYSRVTGRVGVAVVTSGPGVTNTVTGLAVAFVDRVPVVLLSGQVATTVFGRGAVQDGSALGVDVHAITRPVTAFSFQAATAAQAVRGLDDALRIAACERMPVHLGLPADVLAASWNDSRCQASASSIGCALDLDALACVLTQLQGARRVAVLAGSGARGDRARRALLRLAERLGARVASTPKAKGVFPETHPLALGVFGFGGTSAAEWVLLEGELDLLLVVGSSLGEFATHNWDARLARCPIVQVDHDPRQLGKNYPVLAVLGDAGAALEALANGVQARSWTADAGQPAHLGGPPPEAAGTPEGRLHPVQVMAELQRCLRLMPTAIVSCDIGAGTAFALQQLALQQSQSWLLNLGFSCMGHALPAALGAHHAAPERPVIAVAGDAAFAMMTGLELHTMVEARAHTARYGGPACLILENTGNAMVHVAGMRQFPGLDPGFALYQRPLDIAGVARATGAHAVRIERTGELEPALMQALEPGRGPTLIEVRVDPDADPPIGSRIESLVRSESGTFGGV